MFSRRSFLTATTAGLLLPAISPRSLFASANERITLGFIGVGKMGAEHHVGQLVKFPDVEIVAMCDVVKERLDAAVERVEKGYEDRKKSGIYKGVKRYHDFRELLAHPDLDAVLIATPDHWHAIPCILAARAKKHIYCEKPLTHNIAEGRRIAQEVAKGGVIFQTGSQQRSEFGGHFRKAVEYIWNGRIGTLKTIRIGVGGPPKPCDLPAQDVPAGTDWDAWLGPAPFRPYNDTLCPRGVHNHFPAWRNYLEYAGGGLADMGAHHFDIAQWAMKMDTSGPVEVIPPKDPQKESGLQFKYANGVTMIHNEFEGEIKADCVFEGTEGKILVSRSGISSLPESILKEPLGTDALHIMESNNHHKNWLNSIRSGKQAICTAETGHRSATICHLANIGYRLRRNLHWDPKTETFQGDAAANQQLIREPRGDWKKV